MNLDPIQVFQITIELGILSAIWKMAVRFTQWDEFVIKVNEYMRDSTKWRESHEISDNSRHTEMIEKHAEMVEKVGQLRGEMNQM